MRLPSGADWDLVSGIGITALAVAAARAVETTREGGLVRDPFAAAFIEAANAPAPMPTRYEEIPPGDVLWSRMSCLIGLRSRFFDDFFAKVGIGQAVILAAGLDCRAFRLAWPDGTTVFEIDQPRVLEFKNRVLAERGARPNCRRETIGADLREDWTIPLRDAGFDPATPTAWLAEGLLPYLRDDAAARLLDTIHQLSASGSSVALEHHDKPDAMHGDPQVAETTARFGIDVRPLFVGGAGRRPREHLSGLGWRTAVASLTELSRRYPHPHASLLSVFGDGSSYVTGTLGA